MNNQRTMDQVIFIIRTKEPIHANHAIMAIMAEKLFPDERSCTNFLDGLIELGLLYYNPRGGILTTTMRGMDKVTVDAYIDILEKLNDIERKRKKFDTEVGRIHRYENRQEHYSWYTKLTNAGKNNICPKCLSVNVPCQCKVDKVTLPYSVKVPRKNASKSKWKYFINKFNIR